MKAARVLRFGSPNVITNDDLPQPEASRKSRGRYSDNSSMRLVAAKLWLPGPPIKIVNETRSNT
jgi:hypothetical protein